MFVLLGPETEKVNSEKHTDGTEGKVSVYHYPSSSFLLELLGVSQQFVRIWKRNIRSSRLQIRRSSSPLLGYCWNGSLRHPRLVSTPWSLWYFSTSGWCHILLMPPRLSRTRAFRRRSPIFAATKLAHFCGDCFDCEAILPHSFFDERNMKLHLLLLCPYGLVMPSFCHIDVYLWNAARLCLAERFSRINFTQAVMFFSADFLYTLHGCSSHYIQLRS